MTQTTPAPLPLWRRVLRRLGILTSTALTGGLAIGLVLTGTDYIAARAAKVEEIAPTPPLPVQTAPAALVQGYETPVAHVGVIEPARETAVAFEAGGTVTEILVDEGDPVTQGTVLARLDTRSLQAEARARGAERDALAAQLELARLTEGRLTKLATTGASSAQRADEARLGVVEIQARIRQVEAVLDTIAVALDKAEIRAPFDSQVGARLMDPGAQAAPGAPVLELLDGGAPILRVGLPAEDAAALSPETTYTIEIAGQPYTAQLTRVRADIDPVTRTVQALFTLATEAPYGTLATLSLTRHHEVTGAWVPLSALTEGPSGLWTLLTVAENTVRRDAVELLYADADRAFVRGIPDATLVITEGPHRVTPGQRVSTGG